ncbi:MAG: LppX_LprAFG lipoprotein [Spirochaetaceae bacterium]|nr:LppX_LprAFG lipoprotein [Spirochaetaceae bacterium]
MHAMRQRPVLSLAFMAVLGLVAGCSGDSTATPDGNAEELLVSAKATIDSADSAHFTITSADVPEGGTALVGGEGSAARPGQFVGSLDVSFGGTTATVEVISTDGTVYAKLPFASAYAVTDPAQFGFGDPGRFMDPEDGVSNLLVKATDARLTGTSRIGSEVVQKVEASIPGTVVRDLIVSADPTKPVDATFSIVEKSGELRRAVVTGPFFDKEVESTFTIVLDRYGEKVDIRAPSTG